MTASEFAARLLESDDTYTPPPADDAGVSDDRELTALRKAALDAIEAATSAADLVDRLARIIDARRSVSGEPELTAAESYRPSNAYEMASALLEGRVPRRRGRPTGRSDVSQFVQALLD